MKPFLFLAALCLCGPSLLAETILRAPEEEPAIPMDSPLWKEQSSQDGIKLYEAAALRDGIVPVKAEMSIEGTIEGISAVLEDIGRRGDWLEYYGESHLLERLNDYQQVEYLRMNMPWPISDRTTLVRVDISVTEDQKTASIAAHSVECCAPKELPVGVRAEVYASSFQMTQDGGQVKVLGLVFINPKGSLPKWAVNLYTRGVARRTLARLRRQAKRGLYDDETLKNMGKRIKGYAAWKKKQAAP